MTSPAAPEAMHAPPVATRSSGTAAVQVDDVSVHYIVPLARAASLKEHLVGRVTRRATTRRHAALQHVSLRIEPGESVGIVGVNGSGKTTLLRLIARVLAPDVGRVRTWGRVAPILDVTGALHPELTGRENIFLNGTLLGLRRRDIAERLDQIVDFAEIGDFIDAPVRTYSSGMMARLGFAIASDTDADVLLVDETLGVGDEHFQRKCAARIDAVRQRGVTFLVVSHDLHSIRRLCPRVVWLDAGRLRADGKADAVLTAFREAP